MNFAVACMEALQLRRRCDPRGLERTEDGQQLAARISRVRRIETHTFVRAARASYRAGITNNSEGNRTAKASLYLRT